MCKVIIMEIESISSMMYPILHRVQRLSKQMMVRKTSLICSRVMIHGWI
nr:MAG TPA: hypothetical protein [Caudoviricetes sp.]